jgi:hypothetical protein
MGTAKRTRREELTFSESDEFGEIRETSSGSGESSFGRAPSLVVVVGVSSTSAGGARVTRSEETRTTSSAI